MNNQDLIKKKMEILYLQFSVSQVILNTGKTTYSIKWLNQDAKTLFERYQEILSKEVLKNHSKCAKIH